ncbi:hypothetical protein PILCRDRAFT_817666 [Piloderma croceum F 1598]|uniref:Uncharacterized protein n=1 Tax=Piloderma croceum (strain F 1598) TaxID=765440 RepID=A0A0C3G2K6_PILCF|nr:hypothetical protein PILCRDRAFT_817666 [Piloderma croceum F 1598]
MPPMIRKFAVTDLSFRERQYTPGAYGCKMVRVSFDAALQRCASWYDSLEAS